MKKLEIGTLAHAFRSEMSEVVHWTIIWALAVVIGLQISQAWAAEVTSINHIYTMFLK